MLSEKYRPKKLDEVVGQKHVILALKRLNADVPHMLFVGPPGTGKTSTAYALAHEKNLPIIELNASDERGINIIRDKVKKLAFTSGKRILLLDEADSLTSDAQHALRRIMERTTGTSFILTANEEWKIIDPIKSRCVIFRFRRLTDKEILQIIAKVLKNEGVIKELTPETKKAIIALVRYVDGDVRKALGLLESLILKGREVTEANIRLLIPPNIAKGILEKAYKGDFEEAYKELEEIILNNQVNVREIIKQFFDAISMLDTNKLVKLRMYMKLAEIERGLNSGCHPLIQLTSFLASVWVYRYAPWGGSSE